MRVLNDNLIDDLWGDDEPEFVVCVCGEQIPQDEGCPQCDGDDPRFDDYRRTCQPPFIHSLLMDEEC